MQSVFGEDRGEVYFSAKKNVNGNVNVIIQIIKLTKLLIQKLIFGMDLEGVAGAKPCCKVSIVNNET
jgi:hypothetical protein